ncbi:MAG: polysaccharide biosynthesis protein [Legionella sp.]|nr:polysaccharide biosynthesis protein [Legionella sp.]
MPYYLGWMGAEAYGLIGFFTMLQASLALLDLGFTITLVRAVTHFKEGVLTINDYCRLSRAIETIFFSFMLLLLLTLLGCSTYIAKYWLHTTGIAVADIQFAVKNMAFCLAFRWMSGIYRAVLTGYEAFSWLSGFNAVINTLRFIGVLPVMAWWGATSYVFFLYQSLVACIELCGCYLKARTYRPKVDKKYSVRDCFQSLSGSWRFSLSIAFTTIAWAAITQLDKFLLSTRLTLTDYGYFSTAIVIANGIFLMTSALTAVMVPRLTAYVALREEKQLIRTYRTTTLWVSTVLAATVCTLVAGSKTFLWAWIGNKAVVNESAVLLSLYVCGNSIFVLTAFPYYLQCAKSKLRLHVIGHIILLISYVPSCILACQYYGALGAAYSWLSTSLAYLFIWVAVVHYHLVPGLHKKWLFNDIGKPCLFAVLAALFYVKLPTNDSRTTSLLWVLGCWVVCYVTACCSIYPIRRLLKQKQHDIQGKQHYPIIEAKLK